MPFNSSLFFHKGQYSSMFACSFYEFSNIDNLYKTFVQ